MKYVIGADNRVQVLAAGEPEPASAALVFASREELLAGAAGWHLRRLVLVWNRLARNKPVQRFENRQIAVDRVWRAIEKLGQPARRGNSRNAGVARQSKADVVVRMLRQPDGATLQELMTATTWQAHSLRGLISRRISRELGLPVQSFRRDGERVYAVAPAPAAAGEAS